VGVLDPGLYKIIAKPVDLLLSPARRMKARINSLLWQVLPVVMMKRHLLTNNTILDDREFMRVFHELSADGRVLLSLREMANIAYWLRRTASLGGSVAEVGVYKGGGARLISAFKGTRHLHLCDTFGGMPTTDSQRDNHHAAGDFADTSLAGVKAYLAGIPEVSFHQGFFPQSVAGSGLESKQFSFVHLDVDIYQSTLDGLRFFWPLLLPGGALISHDYSSQSCQGVKTAFDEFCAEHPEVEVIPLWDTQALILKRRV
jgi:Macrocin-O-methyltransferase (TylF)